MANWMIGVIWAKRYARGLSFCRSSRGMQAGERWPRHSAAGSNILRLQMGTHSELISVGTPLVGAGTPASSEAWQAAFATALPYQEFLARHGTTDQRARWDAFHARVTLTSEQGKLLAGFVRRMPVLVLAGAWCGDCVNQCPIFAHFAAASAAIDLRFLDRDARPDIAAHLKRRTACAGGGFFQRRLHASALLWRSNARCLPFSGSRPDRQQLLHRNRPSARRADRRRDSGLARSIRTRAVDPQALRPPAATARRLRFIRTLGE